MMRLQRRLAWTVALSVFVLGACDDNTSEPDVLTPPAGVTATATTQDRVTVTFAAVSGATSYTIQRATGATGGTFAQVGTTNTTSYADTSVDEETTYRYRVAAVRGSETSGFSTEVSVTTSARAVVTINSDITQSRTFHADTVYLLSGFIHVANSATLTIQPGTKIMGDYNTLGSSLFVMRGAKIRAMGTAEAPVVFTSSRPEGQRQPGDWGGVVIVGNAQINRAGPTIVEGTGTGASNPSIDYSGGNNDADDSGELHYVRIEFAGFAPVQDAELNSLTLAAIGSNTDIDHVQTLAGLDDSFEFFGGTVDAKYLVSYESGDDHFDMSEGYRGRLQYLIAYQTQVLQPRQGAGSVASDPQGIENDGCGSNTSAGCTNGYNSTPLNIPVVANFTLIGRNVLGAGSGEVGMVLRRGTGGHYVNGVIGRMARAAISLRDAQTAQRIADGDLTLNNILITESPVIYQTGQTGGTIDTTAANIVRSANTTASVFTALPATTPANASQIDWTPAANSPAATGGLNAFTGKLLTAAGNFVTPTAYRGAAAPGGEKWWQNWTNFASN